MFLTFEGNRVTVVPSFDALQGPASDARFDVTLIGHAANTDEIVSRIQKVKADVPILVLSAAERSSIPTLAQADTMSASPATNAMILSRLRAIVRRSHGYVEPTLRAGGVRLSRDFHKVDVDGTTVELTRAMAEPG